MAHVRSDAQNAPVHGLGFGVLGPGSKVEGLRSTDQGLAQAGFDTQVRLPAPVGSGSMNLGSGFRVQGSGFRVQGAECRVDAAGCRVQG